MTPLSFELKPLDAFEWAPSVRCYCGYVMRVKYHAATGTTLECVNPACERRGRRYKVPTLALELIEETK